MTATMKLDEAWAKKFYSNNTVDLNLQAPTENESNKIEILDMPSETVTESGLFSTIAATSTKSRDSYLNSILSSSPNNSPTTGCNGTESCVCYKCQRQRRRAAINNKTTDTKSVPNAYTPLKKMNNTSLQSAEEKSVSSSSSTKSTTIIPASMSKTQATPLSTSPKPNSVHKKPSLPKPTLQTTSPVSISSSTSPVSPTPSQKIPKRSGTVRKTPTLTSYEKHLPKPSYSQKDSIYRFDEAKEDQRPVGPKRDLSNILEQQDNYQVSWKDEGTGDDLLSSLMTFQTIFEEKGNENEGLSDLLEQRTKELKHQKIRQQQEALAPKREQIVPRRLDCLTLSYRDGPKHNALTLFHTMKLRNEKERTQAYHMAFQHCIQAKSGLNTWVKKKRTPPVREGSKLIQAARKPTIKRSLLNPLARKSKLIHDDILWASSENLGTIRSKPIETTRPTNDDMIDVISVAHALLPNQQFAANVTPPQNKMPYEHIDTPTKPRQGVPSPVSLSESRDTSSISSSESANGTSYGASKMIGRSGRLFSSLGRKASMKSSKS